MSAVVGLDLSLTNTGVALIEDGEVIELVNFGTKGKRGDGPPEFAQRIFNQSVSLGNWLDEAHEHHGIDHVVLEAPSYGSKHGSGHERAGLWWEVYMWLWIREVPITTVAPNTRAKYITGSGRADKKAVLAAAREMYPVEAKNHDLADALGMAAMGSRYEGFPIETIPLSPKQIDAFEGVTWHR